MQRRKPTPRRFLGCIPLAACLLPVALQVATAAPPPTRLQSARPRIAVLGSAGCIDDAHIQTLRSLGPVTVLDRKSISEGEAIDLLKGVTITVANPYIVPLTRPVLERADSLKLIVMPITGFDRVDLDTAKRKGIRVVNSPDYSLEAVAEDTFALMLAATRHVPEADAAVRQGQLMTSPADENLMGFELSGKTLGVVGLGRIGTRVAEIARGFGMKTIAWDRNTKSVDGVTQVPLEELLAQSDVVSLHLALSKDTAGILTAARLGLMKPTAVLVNTARAELVDEQALYSALDEGRLAAAGLDVISSAEESNPLLKLNNVVLAPHLAYHSREARARCAESVVQAVQSYVAGSGMRSSAPEAQEPTPSAHFHHVHLNVTDPKATIAFYKKFFGANEVRYRGLSDGLFSEKSFILLTKVATPPPIGLGTSLWHIGWAGVDGESEFAWRTKEGIGVQTPVTPFGSNYYMYFWGPDREVIEIWTASKNHRFEHVHLLASNLNSTLGWFHDHLGLAPLLPAAEKVTGVATNYIRVDNVSISVMETPSKGQPRPSWWPAEVGDTFPVTDGTVIDHIAFSFVDIEPVFRRMQSAAVTIVRPIEKSREYGLTSFFVRGPDGLLVEIVEEAPVPEGVWQGKP